MSNTQQGRLYDVMRSLKGFLKATKAENYETNRKPFSSLSLMFSQSSSQILKHLVNNSFIKRTFSTESVKPFSDEWAVQILMDEGKIKRF